MSNDEFIKVELPAIEQLKKLNWQYIEGYKLSPDESNERKSFKHVVLKNKLSRSIKKINPGLQKITLTPGLYGTKFPAIRTYGYRAVLVTTDRVSENVITKVIDSITSNLSQYFSITESFMPYDRNLFSLEGILVPIHVGAKDLQLALRNGG